MQEKLLSYMSYSHKCYHFWVNIFFTILLFKDLKTGSFFFNLQKLTMLCVVCENTDLSFMTFFSLYSLKVLIIGLSVEKYCLKSLSLFH